MAGWRAAFREMDYDSAGCLTRDKCTRFLDRRTRALREAAVRPVAPPADALVPRRAVLLDEAERARRVRVQPAHVALLVLARAERRARVEREQRVPLRPVGAAPPVAEEGVRAAREQEGRDVLAQLRVLDGVERPARVRGDAHHQRRARDRRWSGLDEAHDFQDGGQGGS